MSATDLVLAGAILAGAFALLYRSLWRRGGACPGCESPCAAGRPRPGLVTLGGSRGAATAAGQKGRLA